MNIKQILAALPKEMIFKSDMDGDVYHIVYLEYYHGKPSAMSTVIEWKPNHYVQWDWDIFEDVQAGNQVCLFNHGAMPVEPMRVPQYSEGYKGTVWMAKGFEMIGNTECLNILDSPLVFGVDASPNPFVYGQVVYSHHHCHRCNGATEEYCDEHLYEDDEGNMRYIDDDSLHQD